MDYNESAQAAAELVRTLYRWGLIKYEDLDKTIDWLQVWLWKNETKAP